METNAGLPARRERPRGRRATERGQHFPSSDGDRHAPLPCEVRKGNDTTPRACCPLTARLAPRGRPPKNGAIDHPQPGADKVDSALPVVRAGAVSLHRLGHLRSFPQRRLAFLTISLSIATGNPATFPLWLERRRPPRQTPEAASARSRASECSLVRLPMLRYSTV